MEEQTPRSRDLTASVPSHERHFYAVDRAFGRFGMRRFAPTPMTAPHWHGHVEVNYLTGASMTYDFDGDRVDVPASQMIIFWAGVPHQLISVSPLGDEAPELANIYIPVDSFLFLPHISAMQVALLGGAIGLLPATLCNRSQIQRWYEDYRSNDFEKIEIMRMELNAILRRALVGDIDWLREPITHSSEGRSISSANIGHVVDMVRFILEHLEDPLTNADVAAVTGLHENYAASLFSNVMRIPIKRFTIRMRLIRARALLIESSAAIATVAENSGFSSVSQFYEHFKSAYGLSPNMLRKHYANMRLR
ncbi:MAG: helix-turn-helix domain-containing protein [Pseudomonadota bacterium]